MRVTLAAVTGLAVGVAGGIVLGDYPLSGSVPWVAALVIPLLIGSAMTLVAGGRRIALWAATGPLAAASYAWGVWIASGRGLDPVRTGVWAAGALALVWPLAWAALARRMPAGRPTSTAPAARPGPGIEGSRETGPAT